MDNKLRIGAVYALLAVAVVALLMANAERSFDLTDVFGIAAMVAVGSIMAFLIFRRPRVAVWGSGLTAFVAVVAVQLAVGDERRVGAALLSGVVLAASMGGLAHWIRGARQRAQQQEAGEAQ